MPLMSSSSVSSNSATHLTRLKEILQEIEPREFESLVAALVSDVLGVGIAVAKSGFQHGGDAGPGGRQERRFRIETKRYADKTNLSDRELLGEIDHALTRDPALEAWFLAATRDAPEQLEQDLLRKSDQLGLPIVVVDWKLDTFPALAALCTAAPDVMYDMVSREAGDIARALASKGESRLDQLKRDMQAWNLGFERIRECSHQYLGKVWNDQRTSVATLGQDVAGGAAPTTITRMALHDDFDSWWSGRATEDAPAVVLGNEGVGKTWATMHWLIDRVGLQPIMLVIRSGAVAGLADISQANVMRFIGDRLYEITQIRDQAHWRLRLDRLLRRPKEEGPVLTLVFDGLNQEPSMRWADLLKTLQHPAFGGRIRVIATTRNLHFSERLKHLRGLVIGPESVEIGPYDDGPGGELDQRLTQEGLTRSDLHPDLIEIARTPRLFSLVVRLRHQLKDGGQVTIHRLLWEYGRDTLGVRDRSLSEQEWRTWLADVARNRREGIRDYNLGRIGTMVDRADLDENDVFRRLSDIVDGRFAANDGTGMLKLTPTIASHALGAALLEHLRCVEKDPGPGSLESALTDWLDPIAAIDERAEILRAAVSIMLESGLAGQDAILGSLVKEWLQSQNLPETHRGEIVRLASALCGPLLDIVETTWDPARNLAVDALRRISRDDMASRELIIARCEAWLKTVSRDVDHPAHRNTDADQARSKRLIKRIGVDVDGERIVLGERLMFVERQDHDALRAIPTLLDGYPLVPVLPVFSAAAFAMAIRGRDDFWSGLKWLCLLNEIDVEDTTAALKAHSDAVQVRSPEDGIHPDLAPRIAALLLWLTGDEDMEALAVLTDRGLDRGPDYMAEYLADPGRSVFSLQRRHADPVMRDTTLPLSRRIDKVGSFQTDPKLELPEAFVAEVRAAYADFDVSALDAHFGRSAEDHHWEDIKLVLARAAPDLLATLVRRKLDGLVNRESDKLRIGLSRSTADFLLADRMTPDALATLSARSTEIEDSDKNEQGFARSRALMLTVASLPPSQQIIFLLDQDAALYIDFAEVLLPLEPAEVDALVDRYRDSKRAIELVRILSLVEAPPGEGSWDWFVDKALEPASDAASRLLYTADAGRFGRDLLSRDWSWDHGRSDWGNHYGSLAVIEATLGLPFEQILIRVAPWLAPRALALRGGNQADADLATQLIDGILLLNGQSAPDLGSDVAISESARAEDPEAFTLSIRQEDQGSLIDNLRLALDKTAASEARSRAVPIALERMREARREGASLFMRDFAACDLDPIVRHTPLAVERWLVGVDGPSPEFERRALLAEGFYLALCETLLIVEPGDGARLWRALRALSRIGFIGAAGVDRLTLMLHRVPSVPDALRREQLDLPQTRTDEGLFEVALASRLSGDTAWLENFIRKETASVETWRRQRGQILRGFLGTGEVPLNEDELDEPGASLREDRKKREERWCRREVWAKHWWNRYWNADTDDEAYAAWILLLQVTDRRAHAWIDVSSGMHEHRPRRVAHYRLNRDDLVRGMEKAEKKMDGEFLARSIFDGVHPWLQRPD